MAWLMGFDQLVWSGSYIDSSCDPKEAKACKLTALRFAVVSCILSEKFKPLLANPAALAALIVKVCPSVVNDCKTVPSGKFNDKL